MYNFCIAATSYNFDAIVALLRVSIIGILEKCDISLETKGSEIKLVVHIFILFKFLFSSQHA